MIIILTWWHCWEYIKVSIYSPRLLSFRKFSFTSQNISSDVLYMQQRSLWYHFSNFQHFREQKYWWQVWLLCGSASEWASLFCLTRYGHTALALRPDVLNAEHHVKTNATYSCHNHTLYQQSSKHVPYIETCTLLCCDHITLWKVPMQTWCKTVLAAQTKTSKFKKDINGSVDKSRRKTLVNNIGYSCRLHKKLDRNLYVM